MTDNKVFENLAKVFDVKYLIRYTKTAKEWDEDKALFNKLEAPSSGSFKKITHPLFSTDTDDMIVFVFQNKEKYWIPLQEYQLLKEAFSQVTKSMTYWYVQGVGRKELHCIFV